MISPLFSFKYSQQLLQQVTSQNYVFHLTIVHFVFLSHNVPKTETFCLLRGHTAGNQPIKMWTHQFEIQKTVRSTAIAYSQQHLADKNTQLSCKLRLVNAQHVQIFWYFSWHYFLGKWRMNSLDLNVHFALVWCLIVQMC